MSPYSRMLDDAIAFAAVQHREQARKGSEIPYIAHPFMVSMLLTRAGLPESVVVAGVLHDVVEDQDVTLQQVAERFGDEVAALVAEVTEQKAEDDGSERAWRVRKQEQLDHLTGLSVHGAALKAADALHNCVATVRDHGLLGPRVWERFNAGRDEQCWYYRELAVRLERRLGDHVLARELASAVRALESCD